MSKYPIFVIEGPDGSGKTTLGKRLAKVIGGKYVHLTYRYPTAMFTYHHAAIQYVLKVAERGPVVLDRWWMSELAYAAVYRNGSQWPYIKRLLHRYVLTHDITYVMCVPDDRVRFVDHFAELKGKREEMYLHNMELVYDQFLGWHNWVVGDECLNQRYDLFDVLDGLVDLDEVVGTIAARAKRWRSLRPDLDYLEFPTITGDLNLADCLLMMHTEKCGRRRDLPSFTDKTPMNIMMALALDRYGVRDSSFMTVGLEGLDPEIVKLDMRKRGFTHAHILAPHANQANWDDQIREIFR